MLNEGKNVLAEMSSNNNTMLRQVCCSEVSPDTEDKAGV
jgi:hypothetical protein